MRTSAIASLALALAGCLQPVGTTAEPTDPVALGGLAASMLSALADGVDGDAARALLADEDGPYPFVVTTYLEEGDHLPDGLVAERAWGATSVARSPDGRVFDLVEDGVPTVQMVVGGVLADDAVVFPVLGRDGYDGPTIAVVREGAETAQLLSGFSAVEPVSLPMGRAPEGAVEPPELDQTVALRWLRTCPGLLEECVLYGTAADVTAAADPIEPNGGWFLNAQDAVLNPPPDARFTTVERYRGDGATLRVERTPADPADDGTEWAFYRAWVETAGFREHAFDYVGPSDPGLVAAGVARDGDRFVAWLWRPEEVIASFSEHDARTGARISTPVTFSGEPYVEPDCGNVYTGTRPMPVRIGGDLALALWWGGPDILLFDGHSPSGTDATITLPTEDTWYTDLEEQDVPAVLHLAR